MGKCFVIQPFDKGPFDKRYRDVFSPRDWRVRIWSRIASTRTQRQMLLIDDIEEGI